MLPDDTRKKIKNIAAGTILQGQPDHCTTARNLLCRSYPTSTTVKEGFEGKAIAKKEQADQLEQYSKQHDFWIQTLPKEEVYLTKGGEARVYLDNDRRHVTKLNDAVYYATWLEFLNSILLHNLFFPNTSYELIGFAKEDETLLAVVKQPFIISDAIAGLSEIKAFLEFNGFKNTRRQDYEHLELGLILEDMHDENVLVREDTLFFIDTVFYTVAPKT